MHPRIVFNGIICEKIMKISATVKKQLNDQITLEANASQVYLAMASWSETTGYRGAASYFYAQSAEERDHMLKIINYMNTIGVGAIISGINKPETSSFKSLEGIIKASLKNEQIVTKAIHKIIQTVQKEGDYSTYDFLSWFVKEQIHEEAQFEEILQKFDIIGRDGVAINEIDKILGTRTITNTLDSQAPDGA